MTGVVEFSEVARSESVNLLMSFSIAAGMSSTQAVPLKRHDIAGIWMVADALTRSNIQVCDGKSNQKRIKKNSTGRCSMICSFGIRGTSLQLTPFSSLKSESRWASKFM